MCADSVISYSGIAVSFIRYGCLPNGPVKVCCTGLCGGVRFIRVFMYVAQVETDGVKIMLIF